MTRTPPTFVADYDNTNWQTNTSPKTQSVTVANGDVLAIGGETDDNLTTLNTPTGGSLTYTLQDSVVVTDYNWTGIWTALPGSSQTYTFSQSRGGSGVERWGNKVLRFSGSDGVGAHAKNNGTSGGPSVALTTTADNSAVVVIAGDWNGVSGASRVWRTVNSVTPTSGNGYERHYDLDSVPDARYLAYYPDVGAAGSKTFGLSTPSSGMHWSIVAVEIKGTGVSGVTGTGSVALKKASLSAAGTEKFTGTGSVQVKKASLSAAGTEKFIATGSVGLKKPSLAASGTEKFIATGSVALKKPSLSAAGTPKYIGTGSVSLHKPSLSASGTPKYIFTGGVGLKKPSFSGSGTEKISGTGSVALHKPSLRGSNYAAIGTGSVRVKKASLSGAGSQILNNSAEGQSSGTTVSAANSGGASRAAFDTVQVAGSGGSFTYDNTHAMHGALSYKSVGGSPAGNNTLQWTSRLTGTSVTQIWFRAYVYITANPASQLRWIRGLSSGTFRCGIALNTASKLACLDASGTSRGTAATALPFNQWVRIEGYLIGSATVGQMEFKYWTNADSTGSPTETITTASNLNNGGDFNRIDFGNPSSTASYTHWMDDLGASLIGYMGPLNGSTGSIGLKKPSLSGAGKETISGTGSVRVKKASLSAAGTPKYIATGSVSLHKPSLSGSAKETESGTGSVSLHKPSLSASGTEKISGTGSVSLHKMGVSGSAVEKVAGTGSVRLHKPGLSGSGTEKFIGSGSVSLHKMSVSGVDTNVGQGGVQLHKPGLSGDAAQEIPGTGGVSLHKMGIQSHGGFRIHASPLLVFAPV